MAEPRFEPSRKNRPDLFQTSVPNRPAPSDTKGDNENQNRVARRPAVPLWPVLFETVPVSGLPCSLGAMVSRNQAQPRQSEIRGRQSAVEFSGNVLIKQAMFGVRKIADVRDRARAPNVSAQFIRVAFAHKNPAVAPDETGLRDFSRCAVVVTDFINRVQSVYARREMQCGDLLIAVEFEIALRWRTFTRTNEPRMRTASTRRK